MRGLIDTLKERSTRIAETARDRGLGALDKVRSGTLDWHRTLEARRTELESAERPRWFAPIGGLQILVIDRMDRVIERFSERVREEIARLQQLELVTGEAAVAAVPKKSTKAAKRPKAKAAPRVNGKASRRLVMPIAGYDELNVKAIVSEVGRLSEAQCQVVREHEVGHKNRKTVLKAIDARLTA